MIQDELAAMYASVRKLTSTTHSIMLNRRAAAAAADPAAAPASGAASHAHPEVRKPAAVRKRRPAKHG